MAFNKAYVVIESVSVMTAPPIGALYDAFDGSSLDTTKWTVVAGYDVTVSESSGALNLSVPASVGDFWGGVISNNTYDLTDSAIYVKMAPGGNFYTTGIYLQPTNVISPSTVGPAICMSVANGVFLACSNNNSALPSYNSSTMGWLRIRESWGVVYFDTSPDGTTWTNQSACPDAQAGLTDFTSLYVALITRTGPPIAAGSVSYASLNIFSGDVPPELAPGRVAASAVILSPTNSVVAVLPPTGAAFSYGDSNEDVREAVKIAVLEAVVRAGIDTPGLDIEIVAR